MAIPTKSKAKNTTAQKTAAPVKAPAAAKPAPAAKPAVAAAPAAGAAKAAPPPRVKTVPSSQRRNYVEVAAYYIAERHGFTPGRELADWATAEAEIDRLLAAGLLNP